MNSYEEIFSTSHIVDSNRILYTPSSFAKEALLHIQETGELKAIKPHTSGRSGMNSYLCFIVEDGDGELSFENHTYELHKGDCVFIDCQKEYSHSTGYNNGKLWTLKWCHFYSSNMYLIYEKYKERGGTPVFHPHNIKLISDIMSDIYKVAASSDYVRDMKINELLASLICMLMEESWNLENASSAHKKSEIVAIKEYLDENYKERISLDELANTFYISKYYMLRLFSESYGTTINNYINILRITRAKQMLRFSDMRIDEIGQAVGMEDPNYFSRAFKKVEGISPSEYRKVW